MPRPTFEDAVQEILERDSRYHRDAYGFLRDALDHTMREIRKDEDEDRHVSGDELLNGFREYSLSEFGPMAQSVLADWGVLACEDVGHMVFNLIGVGVFGKSEDDQLEDFVGNFDFEEAFQEPFRPSRRMGDDNGLGQRSSPRNLTADNTSVENDG